MITITSKRIMFTIENATSDYKLSGSYNVLDDNRIVDFSGQFYKMVAPVEDAENAEPTAEYCGSFYYTENENGKANKSISDIDSDIQAVVCDLLDETLAEVKNYKG